LVEHQFPKLKAAGSNPVFRSKFSMKYSWIAICLLFVSEYSQAQYLDQILNKLNAVSDLKNDVQLVRTTLEKNDPNLYLYISKKDLNYKFDSLKNTITKPITSTALYIKLQSVISYIGDGHLTINIDQSKFTDSDITYLKTPIKLHPIYQFDYRLINKHLFIIKNFSADSTILPGTEILSINKMPIPKILDTLNRYITSDGYNITYKEFLMNVGLFAERFRFLYADTSVLTLTLKTTDATRQITLKPFNKSGYDSSGIAPPPHTIYKLLKPGSIAYLKLNTFWNGADYEGYHGIFADIKQKKIKTLIIDLRGNGGGETAWAASIFTFLIDTPTYFYRMPNKAEQQLFSNNEKTLDWMKVEAKKYTYPKANPDTSIFKGKIYVLINGGSFSATSLLAANIRTLKNVTFVGEETGGSSNIWTAGIIKTQILPTTKLILTYGTIPSFFGDLTSITGRGLMPDVPITYTIQDFLNGKDLEMDWVMKDIERSAVKN
jgi:hypothetical protein